jgi:hypothetical protein
MSEGEGEEGLDVVLVPARRSPGRHVQMWWASVLPDAMLPNCGPTVELHVIILPEVGSPGGCLVMTNL